VCLGVFCLIFFVFFFLFGGDYVVWFCEVGSNCMIIVKLVGVR